MSEERVKHFVQDADDILQLSDYSNAYTDMLARYSADTGLVNIAPQHMESCLKLAASTCLDKLAAYFASEGNSTINSDSVDHQSKSDRYRRLANSYRKQYQEQTTKTTTGTAAGAIVALPKRQRMV